MDRQLSIVGADSPAMLDRLRAWLARDHAALRALERHQAQPRYRPAFTRMAERDEHPLAYALISHVRLRLGGATIEVGQIDGLNTQLAESEPAAFVALLGDCLHVLVEEGLPLALLRGPAQPFASFGFAPYQFQSTLDLALAAGGAASGLRAASEQDLDDLAALHADSYQALPLSPLRARPDWRFWLEGAPTALLLEDPRGRVVAYAVAEPETQTFVEAAAADAGAARALCRALQAYAQAQGWPLLRLALAPAHVLAQAALQLGGSLRLVAAADRPQSMLAGVVDLPMLLEALAPAFEQRLSGSRYAGWRGNLRIEIETERIVLALAAGRAGVIDGSRRADLRLRQVELPALAQLLLGYRSAADLRATGGLACDDSALGLLDTLFPALLASQ